MNQYLQRVGDQYYNKYTYAPSAFYQQAKTAYESLLSSESPANLMDILSSYLYGFISGDVNF